MDGINNGFVSEMAIDNVLEEVLGYNLKAGLDFEQFKTAMDNILKIYDEDDDDGEEDDDEVEKGPCLNKHSNLMGMGKVSMIPRLEGIRISLYIYMYRL